MLQVENVGGAIIVKVRGEIDVSGRDVFRRTLSCAGDGTNGALIVSFEDCSYCDCSAVGVLAGIRRTIGSRLQVVIPTDSPVRRLFDLSGLLEALEPASSLTQALSGLRYGQEARALSA